MKPKKLFPIFMLLLPPLVFLAGCGGGNGGGGGAGDIDGTAVTWSGTVEVDSIVHVSHGGVLTILPGTTIRFAQGAGLLVGYGSEGTLIADGEPANKITFTGTSPTPGWWCGIELGEQTRCDAGHTLMDNCIIEYTGNSGGSGRQPAAIGAWGSGGAGPRLPLTNIEIRNYTAYGFVLTDGAEFASACLGLKIHEGNCPFYVDANTVRTIPADTQNLYTNSRNVVEVGGNDPRVTITGTWPKIFAPVYCLMNDLNVYGCTLTIAAGCTIRVAFGCRIDVGDTGGSGTPAATLNCPGTSTSPGAYFTAENNTYGGWGGIWFYDNTFGDLQYVTVEKGGGVAASGYAGNIYIYRGTMQNTPTIQHSTIRYAYNSAIPATTYGIVGYYHNKSYTGATDSNSFYSNGPTPPGTNSEKLISF